MTRFYLVYFTKFPRSLCCKLELFGEGEGRLFFPTSHVVLLLEAFLGGGIAVNSKHNLQHHSMGIRVFPRKAYTEFVTKGMLYCLESYPESWPESF